MIAQRADFALVERKSIQARDLMRNPKQHSYEEIRDVVVEVLLNPPPEAIVQHSPLQWNYLLTSVGIVFAQREGHQLHPNDAQRFMSPSDRELVRDVFWDLFRQGIIILGMNDANPMWPWFRLSHFGQKTLQNQNPYRFHDTTSFLALVRNEVPDISPDTITYLDEAVAAFYAGCLLASCVMLGVAAEAEFLRLIDVAAKSPTHGSAFAVTQKPRFIHEKITKFASILKPLIPSLPRPATEDLETNFMPIQSVLRISRNNAGHPTGLAAPGREMVFVYLQLFIPFARQLMRLRHALT